MQRASTTLASKAHALLRYGRAVGIEPDRWLASRRLRSLEVASGADRRVASDVVEGLWSDLLRWTGSPALGLQVAESEATSMAFGVVGFRAMTSGTVHEALQCFERHARVVHAGSAARVSLSPQAVTFEEVLPCRGALREPMMDRALASCLLLVRRWTGEAVRARLVRLRRDRPVDVSGYERIFGGPVVFGQSVDSVAFDRAVTELPLRFVQGELAGYLEGLAREAQAGLPSDDAGGAVSEVVRGQLPGGDPGLRVVARKLGVSARTLQRRLLAEGLSYNGVVDQVRRELAVELVASSALPLADVQQRVGYSEERAFRRAFHRWTGASPAQLRHLSTRTTPSSSSTK